MAASRLQTVSLSEQLFSNSRYNVEGDEQTESGFYKSFMRGWLTILAHTIHQCLSEVELIVPVSFVVCVY